MNDEAETDLLPVPDYPEFTRRGDKSKSPIPVTKVASWRDFTRVLDDEFFNRPNTELVYRGQHREEWGLSPSLARLDENQVITPENAAEQLRFFRQAVRGRIADMSLVSEAETDELWSVGQHHGLKTPVLDWTLSPYVALFFAFEREDDTPKFRAIYAMNKTYFMKQTQDAGDDKEQIPVRIYEPIKDSFGRLVNQAGLFTVSGYDATFENQLMKALECELIDLSEDEADAKISQYVCKILIPNDDQEGCLRMLLRMNVHHASLFPDLEGAAKYCNYRIQSLRTEQKRAEERARLNLPVEAKPTTESQSQPEQITPVIPDVPVPQAIWAVLRAAIPEDLIMDEQIGQLAQDVVNAVESKKVPDWEIRDSIQAEMRNAVRAVLRQSAIFPNEKLKAAGAEVVEIITREAKKQSEQSEQTSESTL